MHKNIATEPPSLCYLGGVADDHPRNPITNTDLIQVGD